MKNISIPAGGMYQKWMSLIDLVEEETAKKLNKTAENVGWYQVRPKDAMDIGFEELVKWSKPETDALVLVGDNYLVCLNKSDFSIN